MGANVAPTIRAAEKSAAANNLRQFCADLNWYTACAP